MDGVLVCNKPSGFSSNDFLNCLRRWTRQKKMGHAGTLDPDASGVLPVCLGGATRIVPFLMQLPKLYQAEARLGVSTDTQDASGRVIEERSVPPSLGEDEVRAVLARFEGTIEQVPPMYSALKHRGRRLYELARRGEEVERRPRPVRIYSIRFDVYRGDRLRFEVECGSGTYIRTLCHDIGEALGCGAHLVSLVRWRVGPMTLDHSVTLEAMEALADTRGWHKWVRSTDEALSFLPAVTVSGELERRVPHGVGFEGRLESWAGEPEPGTLCRVKGESGKLLAVAAFQPGGGALKGRGFFRIKRVLIPSRSCEGEEATKSI